MQENQPFCEICGWEHTAPVKTSRPNPQDTDMTRKFILIIMHKLKGLCTVNNQWCVDKASQLKKEVELLSTFAHYQGLHGMFPTQYDKACNIDWLIAHLEESHEQLTDEEKTLQDILQQQIDTLKIIECKVYSMYPGKTTSEEGQDEDDHEKGEKEKMFTKSEDVAQRMNSALTTLRIKAEQHGMMKIVDHQSKASGDVDVLRTSSFDDNYHYRRKNKCVRCASTRAIGGKDCFFPLVFDGKAKCTNCRRSGYKCESTIISKGCADNSVTAGLPKIHYPDQEQLPTPAVVLSSPAPSIPAATSPASAIIMPVPALLGPPLTAPTNGSATMSVSNVTVESGKRKAISESRGSSSLKHRRTLESAHQRPMTAGFDASVVSDGLMVNKTTMLRQVTSLNISFESFTDMSLRQVENDRKHCEREAAYEEHKLAYEESKRVFEEKKRAYEESMRLFEEKKRVFEDDEWLRGENKPIYAAMQECFVARSESAGENLIEEATNLLSSIEQGPHLRDVAPVLHHLHTVFADFKGAQNELIKAHKFTGDRAQLLYTLMERIQNAVDIDLEVPVEDRGEESPRHL